ncbi:class I ribonucleotide reductase maintenance protein YfaE [Psychrobacter sp. I-STPA10]|uniref:class I ribonucleotide reductase maintenance protein YfaE n=1 Tax=Psychrobacter sp. I-STPA10 TaxID=2585769 RepID=UPI001E400459|nr:class I ribonucleotide reductase maintenance protein YfaE [Psychrobacter sp. I-STPA10]
MAWIITQQTRFYLHEDETLLDGLLRTGHKVEFQCKSGYCGSCRVKCVKSSQPITYDDNPLAMIEERDILPCCCKVVGVLTIELPLLKTANINKTKK